MKIIFLGTNGWYSSPTGDTPCILLDSKEYYVIFDAGNGIYKLDQYIKEDKPIFLFVSHFHLDHVSGFHMLAKFHFSQGITVCVGPGRKQDFLTLVAPPYTIGTTLSEKNIHNLKMAVRIKELALGENDLGFPVSAHTMSHAYVDHGYRVTLENKVIAYSGDTAICDESYALAQNADVLIHECSYLNSKDDIWGHVGPVDAARLAQEAKVRQLVLTHFDASQYTSLDSRKQAEKDAREIFPNTTSAYDGMTIEVS